MQLLLTQAPSANSIKWWPCLWHEWGIRRRYLNDINTRYGRRIWLTELACPNPNGTLARQLKYARGAFKVLDENDYVERWESCAKSCSRAASLCPTLPPAADTGGGKKMLICRGHLVIVQE